MGMFDHVRHEADCYKCGHNLTRWQSKSGPCNMGTVEPWQVNTLYTNCPKCKAWNQYDVEADVEIKVNSIVFTRATWDDDEDEGK